MTTDTGEPTCRSQADDRDNSLQVDVAVDRAQEGAACTAARQKSAPVCPQRFLQASLLSEIREFHMTTAIAKFIQKPVKAAAPAMTALRRPPVTATVMQGLVQRTCACGGRCPRCEEEASLQKKLRVNQAGDAYE